MIVIQIHAEQEDVKEFGLEGPALSISIAQGLEPVHNLLSVHVGDERSFCGELRIQIALLRLQLQHPLLGLVIEYASFDSLHDVLGGLHGLRQSLLQIVDLGILLDKFLLEGHDHVRNPFYAFIIEHIRHECFGDHSFGPVAPDDFFMACFFQALLLTGVVVVQDSCFAGA